VRQLLQVAAAAVLPLRLSLLLLQTTLIVLVPQQLLLLMQATAVNSNSS
jgi:hypothetical protein